MHPSVKDTVKVSVAWSPLAESDAVSSKVIVEPIKPESFVLIETLEESPLNVKMA